MSELIVKKRKPKKEIKCKGCGIVGINYRMENYKRVCKDCDYEEDPLNIIEIEEEPENEIDKAYRLMEQHEQDLHTKTQDGVCKYCGIGEDYFIKSNGFVVCQECGTTQKKIITDEAEWNNYTGSDGSYGVNKSRCGYPSKSKNPFVSNLSTFMAKGNKLDYINKHGKKTQFDLSRIHMQMNYSHRAKSYDNVKSTIENMTSHIYSSTVLNTAEILWGEIMKANKVTRAGVRKGLIACCVYYACIDSNCPQSPITICKNFHMDDTKQFIKGDKEFKEVFENNTKWSHLLVQTSNSNEFIKTFCIKLELDFRIQAQCSLLYEIHKRELSKVIPKSATAGIIFYICNQENIPLSKTKVSQTLKVCNPTLTKTLAIIEKAEKKRKKKIKKMIQNEQPVPENIKDLPKFKPLKKTIFNSEPMGDLIPLGRSSK